MFARIKESGHVTGKSMALVLNGTMRGVVRTYAERIKEHVLTDMAKPKGGRIYYNLKGKAGPHTASAAGESPAILTGSLSSAIQIEYRLGGMVADIGVLHAGNPAYADLLEEGGKNIEARPYMKPAFDANESMFAHAIRAAFNF